MHATIKTLSFLVLGSSLVAQASKSLPVTQPAKAKAEMPEELRKVMKMPPAQLKNTADKVAKEIRAILAHDRDIEVLKVREKLLEERGVNIRARAEAYQKQRAVLLADLDREMAKVKAEFRGAEQEARLVGLIQGVRPRLTLLKQSEQRMRSELRETGRRLADIRRKRSDRERQKRLHHTERVADPLPPLPPTVPGARQQKPAGNRIRKGSSGPKASLSDVKKALDELRKDIKE